MFYCKFHLFCFQRKNWKKKSQAEIIAIYEEMKKALWRREYGDLKDKDSETKLVIKQIKGKYLGRNEVEQIGNDLVDVQKKIRLERNDKSRTMKDNSEFITQHLKITCRFVMGKYPLD